MFLENAFIGKTEPLRYIGGTIIVIIAYFIASVPFGVAIVMEIGPGDGALTEYLNNKSKSLTLVEIDNDLIRILSKKFELSKNLILKHKDFLKLNLSEVKKDNFHN